MSTSLTKIEPFYVVDTNALIWNLTNSKKLGQSASSVFSAAERGETRLLVSAIVLAEMYYANKKYRLFADFRDVYMHLQSQPYIRFVSLESEDILDFDLDSSVPEMHDRIIVGLARRLRVPLLTSDAKIASSNLAEIVWDYGRN